MKKPIIFHLLLNKKPHMRHLILTCLLCFSFLLSKSQENNPLINSGKLINEGIKLHDNNQYKEAIELYQKVPRGDTNYYLAIYEMTLSLMADSQHTKALQICEKGLSEVHDWSPSLLTLYGSLIDDMGESERALSIYDSAIVMYPSFSELYLNKGTTLIRLKKYKEAEEVLKQCILINPYQSSSHYKLGVCALQQGKILQGFFSHIFYLLLQPGGYYKNNCISSLSAISKGGDDIRMLMQERSEEQNSNFETIERIIVSKIALEKQYKPIIKLDDQISRQIQVALEKLEYDDKDPDFWMQYYVPLLKVFFTQKKFEPFIYRLFATVNIEIIQDYIKKKGKSLQEIIDETVAYCDQIRTTRELNYPARKAMTALYHFDEGRLYGKGKTINNGETNVGEWEYYYRPGNVSSKGMFNDKGERTDLWKYFYFNGKLRGQKTFLNDKLNGREIFYHENGLVSSDANFVDDKETGESKSYFFTGSPRAIVNYSNGKLNGLRRTFFSNGNLKSIENYKEDQLHGAFKTYFSTGILESEGNYTDGEIDGPYKSYFDNTRLSAEGEYKEGKLNGVWKLYHENGKLKSIQTYISGVAEGEYTEYHDNEKLYYKCIYKNGKASGDVEYFDDDGKLHFIYTMDNDIIKSAKYFDKTGKEISRSERKSKSLDLTTYYPEGIKLSTATYDDEGLINGSQIFYYRSGKPRNEYFYEKGELEGPGKTYHPNGRIQASVFYKEGKKDGYQKFWYNHGGLQEEGWYKNGMAEGTWLNYDEMGNISIISNYLNDDINGYKEEYYPNGIKASETKFKRGWIQEYIDYDTTGKEINRSVIPNGNGNIRSVFFNGKTYSEGTYVNSELDGPYKYYFFDGKLHSLFFYKKGRLDSIYRQYYYDGKTAIEGAYRLGQKEGVWKTYFTSGKLNLTETYVNGELEGKKVFYHENGKIDTEIEFKKGERNGWLKKFDTEGNLLYQVRFIEDYPVAYTYNEKTGKLLSEIPIPGGTGKIKTYFSNGNLSTEYEYVDGQINGTNKQYYSNGRIQFEGTEDHGLSQGKYKYYYPTGQLKNDYYYEHDNVHGPYTEYNINGTIKEEGYYYNGLLHNTMKVYDETGKLKETRIYYYGKLLDIKK